jgi:uncharacterized protein YbjQ (UPF0145 family)
VTNDPGDLAERALTRLRGAPPPHPRRAVPFTCDLSVDELLLVEEAGYEPVGIVTGSSVYSVAPYSRMIPWYASQEVNDVSTALYGARRLAMNRMLQDARGMAAHGVVGVRLSVDLESWGELRAEFSAIGTAVRARSGVGQDPPFTSNLSGRDFYALWLSGHHPTGLVMGACVWHVSQQDPMQWLRTRGRNVELTAYTEGVYAARELAMARMTHEATLSGARGIVGVTVEERPNAWGSHTVEFLALGTAVTVVAPAPGTTRPRPVLGLERG